MVTKSLIETPFGSKFIYRIDGEYTWSEYIEFDRSSENAVSKCVVSHMRRVWNAFARTLQLVW